MIPCEQFLKKKFIYGKLILFPPFRYQIHHRAPGQCEQMQGRVNNSNPSSYSQPRNNQRGTGTSNMELIPPNTPNPKAARYSVNQKSVGTEGQSQYPRPSGRGSIIIYVLNDYINNRNFEAHIDVPSHHHSHLHTYL